MTSSTPPKPKERVLSTLNTDGSRLKPKPKPVVGAFYKKRRALAYLLMALFVAMPIVHVNGRPMMLLDLVKRQFTLFGYTFLASDTVLLMIFLVGLVVSVFLLTALFGRVWCGWACPQTVYMEFLFRPLERWLEGKTYSSKKKKPPRSRLLLKYLIYLGLSLLLAHIFLAYFVGLKPLLGWLARSPVDHPEAFVVMAATTTLIFFDFTYFREQTCIVACPYGRLQAVLLDRQSMIVGYDENRGEPRGPRKKSLTDEQRAALGDCVNCKSCVRVCPMGIDIRDGLQLECITCTSCVDACDATMTRMKMPNGLVRYTSQEEQLSGSRKLIRPRVLIYPAIILFTAVAFTLVLSNKGDADVTLLRGIGSPYTVLEGDRVSNQLRVKVVNRTRKEDKFTITLDKVGPELKMIAPINPLPVAGEKAATATVFVLAPKKTFKNGERLITIKLNSERGFVTSLTYRILGPGGTRAAGNAGSAANTTPKP